MNHSTRPPRRVWNVGSAFVMTLALALPAGAGPAVVYSMEPTTDAALVERLPGFRSAHAEVNGTRLHYVTGGTGPALVLLPGWPETWWTYHKIMPALAQRYTVLAVDLRGMGSSAKPEQGYEKKTMAKDVRELLLKLGHTEAAVVGHDIGAQVAWSFAANHPEARPSW